MTRPGPTARPAAERFWPKVDQSAGLFECWLWTGGGYQGYGRFADADHRWIKAARFAYELLVGPIPEGLVLDHLCRNRPCVNPAHLEPVTNRENILRGESPAAQAARRNACQRGHPYMPETTSHYRGKRICRICRRVNDRRYRAQASRRGLDESASPSLTSSPPPVAAARLGNTPGYAATD